MIVVALRDLSHIEAYECDAGSRRMMVVAGKRQSKDSKRAIYAVRFLRSNNILSDSIACLLWK